MTERLTEELAKRQMDQLLAQQHEQDPTGLRAILEKIAATPDERISQGSWWDSNPMAKSVMEGTSEMLGVAPSGRVMDRLDKAKSPLLRPQTPFGWADWGAGLTADMAQTGLAGVDMAALAPAVGRRAAKSLANELGQVDVMPKIGQEIKFIRYGKPVKNSIDWTNNQNLKGMSVYSLDDNGAAQQTVRGEFSERKNVYIGKGKVVGYGPDDEPLVTDYTFRKATKLEDEKAEYGGISRKQWLKEHGYNERGEKIKP